MSDTGLFKYDISAAGFTCSGTDKYFADSSSVSTGVNVEIQGLTVTTSNFLSVHTWESGEVYDFSTGVSDIGFGTWKKDFTNGTNTMSIFWFESNGLYTYQDEDQDNSVLESVWGITLDGADVMCSDHS